MKDKGFTLLELVVVLVLISITAVFGTRFIADAASSYVGGRERAQGLADARFALERLKRELNVAYGPSVYRSDDNRCVHFVPVIASSRYKDSATGRDMTLVFPLQFQGEDIADSHIAIMADSTGWADYPAALPEGVAVFPGQESAPAQMSLSEAEGSWPENWSFPRESAGKRYTLLDSLQLRYCIADGQLWRAEKTGPSWSEPVLMLTHITPGTRFSGYDESIQLLDFELSIQTRDGTLVLPTQIQVLYEP